MRAGRFQKFWRHLKVIRYFKLFLFIVLVPTLGCQSGAGDLTGRKLTKSQALSLAVELANKECDSSYSTKPFTSSSYSIEFKDGRWHWGSLDLAGEGGFSAAVSFGSRGEDQRVEVFLSTDKIMPLGGDGDR
jgi:hypothetical protein